MSNFIGLLWTLMLWTFVAIKVVGVTFAEWSWWWVFLPWVPVIGTMFSKAGF